MFSDKSQLFRILLQDQILTSLQWSQQIVIEITIALDESVFYAGTLQNIIISNSSFIKKKEVNTSPGKAFPFRVMMKG